MKCFFCLLVFFAGFDASGRLDQKMFRRSLGLDHAIDRTLKECEAEIAFFRLPVACIRAHQSVFLKARAPTIDVINRHCASVVRYRDDLAQLMKIQKVLVPAQSCLKAVKQRIEILRYRRAALD